MRSRVGGSGAVVVLGLLLSLLFVVGFVPGAAGAAPGGNADGPEGAPWRVGDPTFKPPAAKPPIVGTNFHAVWSSLSDHDRAGELVELTESGVKWIRLDVAWGMLQPQGPNSYDLNWGVKVIDKRVKELHDRGFKILMLLDWAPKWSSGTSHMNGVPRDPEEYADAAAWVANRYRDKVQAIEVWNEPDLSHFLANRSPQTYAGLVKAAYRKVKAVNPGMKIIAGAPTYVGTDWYKEAYRFGLAGHYDALGVHPYSGMADKSPKFCDQNPRNIKYSPCNIENLIKMMRANGDGDKKIWATEYGWSTHDNSSYPRPTPNWKRGVTEEQQAQYLIEMQEVLAQWPEVEASFFYVTQDVITSDAHEANFGMLRRNFSKKRSYYALKCVSSSICGPRAGPPNPPTPPGHEPSGRVDLVADGDEWKYETSGVESAGWNRRVFDDSGWPAGATELGHGDGDEATVITPFGQDGSRRVTTYFRKDFDVASAADVSELGLRVRRDDGVVVYVNGQEVWHDNMLEGQTGAQDRASDWARDDGEAWHELTVHANGLVDGRNTIAVSVHQFKPSSTDLSFNLELVGNPRSHVLPDKPATPAGLTATVAGASAVDLSWDAVAGATDYRVYRDGAQITHVRGTNFSDTGLAAGTRYRYQVSAVNSGGESARSARVSATTPKPVPATPSGLTAKATGISTVDLSWNEVAGATSYRVYRDGDRVKSLPGTSFTDRGLAAGTKYTYQVSAVNSAGESPRSAGVSATTLNPIPFSFIESGDRWKFETSGVESSGWQQQVFNDSAWSAGPSELGHGDGDEATVITPLGADGSRRITTYFRKAFDVASAADITELAMKVRRDDGVVVYLNGKEVWRDNMPAGSIGADTTAVTWARDDGKVWHEVTVPSRKLVDGKNTVAVSVHQNARSSSDMSFNLELKGNPNATPAPPEKPATPTGLTATATGSSTVDVSWNAVAGAASYRVYRDGVRVESLPGTSFTDRRLAAGTRYRYQVSAVNSGGESPRSAGVSVTTPPEKPATPTGLTATATGSSTVDVSWNAVAGAASYRVYRDGVRVRSLPRTSFTDRRRAAGTRYTYEVSAVNSAGESPRSAAVSVTTDKPVPTQFVASGDKWKFETSGVESSGWQRTSFDDAAWAAGASELGFGDGDEATVITPRGADGSRRITTYFRDSFRVDSAADFTELAMKVRRDDGVVVYLNGKEVWRDNMPAGSVGANTTAVTWARDDGKVWHEVTVPSRKLVDGKNTVAVSVHQNARSSSDMSFDLELKGLVN